MFPYDNLALYSSTSNASRLLKADEIRGEPLEPIRHHLVCLIGDRNLRIQATNNGQTDRSGESETAHAGNKVRGFWFRGERRRLGETNRRTPPPTPALSRRPCS